MDRIDWFSANIALTTNLSTIPHSFTLNSYNHIYVRHLLWLLLSNRLDLCTHSFIHFNWRNQRKTTSWWASGMIVSNDDDDEDNEEGMKDNNKNNGCVVVDKGQ